MSTTPIILALRTGKGFGLDKESRYHSKKLLLKYLEEKVFNVNDLGKLKIQGCRSRKEGVVGNDRASESSIDRYQTCWLSCSDFAFYIEDYESAMLTTRDLCPRNPLPVKVETAVKFLLYQVTEKDKLILHHISQQPITIRGAPLLGLGNWRSQSTVQSFASALSKVHCKYESTRGPYKEPCPDCVNLCEENPHDFKGCIQHLYKPQLRREGNVTTSEIFKTQLKLACDYVSDHYESRSTFAFLPGQVRLIRTHLLSSNNVYNALIWTIMITGIKLFQRVEETLELTVDKFKQRFFIVHPDGSVKGLAVNFKGKRDSGGDFAIWHDEECPEFSAVTAILLWLALSGIQSGKIFPSKEELFAGTEVPKEAFSYDDFLVEMKLLCTGVLHLDLATEDMRNKIFGTHILRKTAYLFALWGCQQADGTPRTPLVYECADASICQSARHKDPMSIKTYLSDVETLKCALDRQPNDKEKEDHRVGKWEAIHIKSQDTFQQATIGTKKYQKSLVELANNFVKENLGVCLDSPAPFRFGRHSILSVHTRACSYEIDTSKEDELKATLSKVLDQTTLKNVLNLIEKVQNERIRNAVHQTLEAAIHQKGLAPSIAPMITPLRVKKKRKFDIDQDTTHVSLNPDNNTAIEKINKCREKVEQLNLLVLMVKEIRRQITEEGRELMGTLRNFIYKRGRVVDCIQSCHCGKIESFMIANPRFAMSKFCQGKEKCCSKGKKHSSKFGKET
jgi:hypothetical protein